MNTTNSVVGTALVVAVGKWSQDETIGVRVVVGGFFLAVLLSVMEQGSPKLASRFALLVFVVAAFMYVPAIAYKAGLTDIEPPDWDGRIRKSRRGRITGR